MTQYALIIDDNNYNLDVIVRLLAKQGFESITVDHPTKLNETLRSMENVKVVFLDLEMPNVDGFQVLEMLKSNPNFKDVPIIAHTVHISEIKVAHDAGFDGFIGKPLNADNFPRQLENILTGKAVWETA